MTPNPRGRRPGSPDTKAAILDAARPLFAERGFTGTTIRAVAADAGVDPSLVHHYYGTKADLYAASLEMPVSPDEVLGSIEVPADQLGEAFARLFFSIWELPEARVVMFGLLRGGLEGDEDAVRPFREFITTLIRDRLAQPMEGADAEARALAMAAQLVGTAMVRYVVQIEPVASMSVEELVALVGPRLQSYVDG